MSTNPYFESSFSAREADQLLFEDLIIESIQIYGRDYYYLPRTMTNFDKFFGEDAQSDFRQVSQCEMYLESVQGWEGDGSFISNFGMEIRDEATLVVSRKRFKENIGDKFNMLYPREGDIIVFPNEVDRYLRAFEISWVEDDPTFYQLGNLNTFRLKVKVFEFNGETFNTGVEYIDAYNKYASSQRIKLAEGGTGNYIIGETITQGNNFTSTVLAHNIEKNELVITSNINKDAEAHNPDIYMPIIGNQSHATWALEVVVNDAVHLPISDNKVVSNELDDLISTKERNPFSGL